MTFCIVFSQHREHKTINTNDPTKFFFFSCAVVVLNYPCASGELEQKKITIGIQCIFLSFLQSLLYVVCCIADYATKLVNSTYRINNLW